MKKLADDALLLRTWKTWHAEELAEAFAGEHGAIVSKMMAVLARLDINSAGALVATVQQVGWGSVDARVRLVLLHEINETITALRERRGLAGISDPLPPAVNVFFLIKHLLFPLSPAKPEASISLERSSSRSLAQGRDDNPGAPQS
jgi:hypothetical protein